MMPKGCTCRVVVDLWCRVHHPENRVKVRWNSDLGRHQWQLDAGWWVSCLKPQFSDELDGLHAVARHRARFSDRLAYVAWERRMKARQ